MSHRTNTKSTNIIENQQLKLEMIPKTSENWPAIREFFLAYELPEQFAEGDKLRTFAINAWESYLEYGKNKDLDLDELRAIGYYFAKIHDSNSNGPVGQELKYILTVISRIRAQIS